MSEVNAGTLAKIASSARDVGGNTIVSAWINLCRIFCMEFMFNTYIPVDQCSGIQRTKSVYCSLLKVRTTFGLFVKSWRMPHPLGATFNKLDSCNPVQFATKSSSMMIASSVLSKYAVGVCCRQSIGVFDATRTTRHSA